MDEMFRRPDAYVWRPSRINTGIPHPARRYNYWLGGKDHFAADRESGDAVAAAFPSIRVAARENRRFLKRVVTYLSREAGIRQYLDIGTGLPSADNTHEVAQGIEPRSRIVYVDNDPIVLAHARALLVSAPRGATAYIEADVRTPGDILDDTDLCGTLDLSQPVALMLIAVMHFVSEEDDPHGIVTTLLDALPSGSYLAMSHATYDFMPPWSISALNAIDAAGPEGFHPRSRPDVARFFEGLALVEPGIMPICEWRAEDEPDPRPTEEEVAAYGAVARLP